jgi:hypothetical protein
MENPIKKRTNKKKRKKTTNQCSKIIIPYVPNQNQNISDKYIILSIIINIILIILYLYKQKKPEKV